MSLGRKRDFLKPSPRLKGVAIMIKIIQARTDTALSVSCAHVTLVLTIACGGGGAIIIIPILQMRKLRSREVKKLVQKHTASKWKTRDQVQTGFTLLTISLSHQPSLGD